MVLGGFGAARVDLFEALTAALNFGKDTIEAGGPLVGQWSIVPSGDKLVNCGVQFGEAARVFQMKS